MTLLRWLTFLLGFQTVTHSPALLNLFICFDTNTCSTMVLLPLENSDHVVISVSIDFLTDSKQDALFHCIAFDYSRVDWDVLLDHLRSVSWENIFELSASAVASELCEWCQVKIDLYIPQYKYHVKCHSSSWFSAACAAGIVIDITFFISINRMNLLNLK